MAREKANAFNSQFFGDLMHDAQQIGQVGSVGDIHTVAVDDLPEQRHFLHALPRQAANMSDDFTDSPAALHAAAEGDDAEGTGVRNSRRQPAHAR